MLSFGLMASTLLLAYGGLAFADAGVAPQAFDAFGSSCELSFHGVAPKLAAPSDFSFAGKTWVFNSNVSTSSSKASSVDASCGGVPLTFINVDAAYEKLQFTLDSVLTDVYSSAAWVSESYRTVVFNADISDSSLKNWVYDNGIEYDPTLGEQIVEIIGTGLGVITELGNALSSGFDAIFLDSDALTNVGVFSFVLLGLGISVGITKKCFNWITGRHGM